MVARDRSRVVLVLVFERRLVLREDRMVVLLVMLVPHIHSRIHEASSRATPGVSIGIRIGAIHYCRKRDGTGTKLFSAQYSVMKRELTGDQMTTWLSLG